MFTTKRSQLLDWKAWRMAFLGRAWGTILTNGDKAMADLKRDLLKDAYGVCLEIGPGLGHSLKYLRKDKIKHVYGIEPTEMLHAGLRKEIVALGLKDTYTIISCGIQDQESLRLAKIEPGTIDTIIAVQVLCSIPRPLEMMKSLQEMLKPGGQVLLFEHVQSKDPVSKRLQSLYQIIWPHLLDGCCIDRPSGTWFKSLGGWKEVEIYRPKREKG